MLSGRLDNNSWMMKLCIAIIFTIIVFTIIWGGIVLVLSGGDFPSPIH